ncbi:hypothetical protein IAR55_005331 [Kwoniella newhampshirensis]|uniref:CFEM domain-containing protein n=1 Tax=Kwoniella newhampshirensis TaxID=1651941 RepID=A0AAW0YZ22_9TREE
MAPSQFDLVSSYYKRQQSITVPVCVATCMASGDTTGCTGVTDFTCVCASGDYISSVASCWASQCNATEAAIGETYSQNACAHYGVPIAGSNVTSVVNSTGTQAPISASSAASSTPLPTVFYGNPNVISPAFHRIQAIMTSICSALLALAIVLGFLACRAKYKREQRMTENRSWTGVGSTALSGETKSKQSRFFSRSGHSSAFSNSRNATTTFASDSYGVTSSSFGGSTTLAGSPNYANQSFGPILSGNGKADRGDGATSPNGERFTNRTTTLGGILGKDDRSEEWEMETKKDHQSQYGDEELSPTASTSKMGMSSEVELVDEGSTVHLNRLDKGDGPRAI